MRRGTAEPAVHCFLQCTRPIHSARRQKPLTAASPDTRCTGSVCRLSAAKSDSSSEESPSAAGAASPGSRCSQASTLRSSDGVLAQGQIAPQPFRSCFKDGSSLRPAQTGRDGLAARNRLYEETIPSEPSPGPPLSFRRVLLRPLSPTTAVEVPDRPRSGAGMPLPVAAVVPALVSVFDSRVTWLGRVTVRSAWVCAAVKQAILSRLKQSDFPLRKQKLGVSLPHGWFAIRLRLPGISLASPPSLVRLGLSWLSFSRPGFSPGPRSGPLRYCLSPGSNSPRQHGCRNSPYSEQAHQPP